MRELGQDNAGNVTELQGILQHLETALAEIDRLQLMVIGAQLSQVIEEIRALVEG